MSAVTLHVPTGKEALYRAAEVWKDFGTITEPGGGSGGGNPIPGSNLTWELSDGTLTISGNGAMPDYDDDLDIAPPWFEHSESITAVTIHDGVTGIGRQAFYDFPVLTSVTIPNRVTSIGVAAFGFCEALPSITIPAGVTSIGDAAFLGCSGLSAIMVDEANPAYAAVEGVLFNKDKTALVQYPAGKTGNSYTIPGSVAHIGMGAFHQCSLTSVTIPAGVTSIGDGAFFNCTALTSVTVKWPTPLAISFANYVFAGDDNDNLPPRTLYVPAGTEALYQAAPVWGEFNISGSSGALAVAPSSLDFAAAGGTETVAVTSDIGWTASADAAWLTVTPASGDGDGTVDITAAANDGSARSATVTVSGSGLTQTVTVTQAEGEQGVIVEPTPPVDDVPGYYLVLSLVVPVDDPLSGSFFVIFPPGINLDMENTELSGSLADRHTLSITPVAAGTWLFEIRPKTSTRSSTRAGAMQEIVKIAWTTDPTLPVDTYEVKIA